MNNNIIVGNYHRSGSRYLTALLCSRFTKLSKWMSNTYTTFNDMVQESKNNMIMKTVCRDIAVIQNRMIYVVRDPRDVIATLLTENNENTNVQVCNNASIEWVIHNYNMMYNADKSDILFIKYEDMIKKEDEVVSTIGGYLKLTPNPDNKTRVNELKISFRPIGEYETILSKSELKIVEDIVKDCVCDLEDYY
jgi:hypothetical protein